MRINILLLIGLIAFISTAQGWTGFTSVVSRITDYQTPSGGFRGIDGKASTEATANGLLLASLYGLRNRVNTTEAAKYIVSVENTDGGYAPAPGSPSDIESVRNALLSLQHLGGKPTHPAKVVDYIKTLIDKDNSLFAYRSGDKGTIQATALALQSLELLGELNQKFVQELFPKIKEYLNKAKTTVGDYVFFKFADEAIYSQVSANYYAIIVGKYVGFDFGETAKWAKYITGLQSPSGQFFNSIDKRSTSLLSTSHAVHALHTLGALKGERLIDALNLDTLKAGVRHVADDVSSAAHAHGALALTKAFKDFFKTVVNYDGADSNYIIEGSNLRPSLSLSTIFNEKATFPHGDFEVSSQTTFEGKEATKGKLTWDQEFQRYVGEHLPTVGNLGPVKVLFNLVHKVAGLGDLAFDLLETKSVGYGLNVNAVVSQDGREIKEGESVSVGTEFRFTLSTQQKATSDFVVTLTVLDSSNVVIHTAKAESGKALAFSYTLSSAAIPAGQLSFRFDIGKGVAHTTKTLAYKYSVPFVATNIAVSSKTFKIGEKAKITFEPAAFPDLRTPQVLPNKDANGADISAERKFVLDIKTTQGVLIRSVDATATKGSSKYTFEYTIEPSLESIGTQQLYFRYIPAVGEDIVLQNFDVKTGELQEDNELNYNVNADLTLETSEAPKAGNLFYGGNVAYKFKIKDTVSGQYVASGDKARAYLDLVHDDAGRTYTSVHHAATVKDNVFNVDWLINPNAAKGAGSLQLALVNADGVAIPLKEAKAVKVSIGGDIDVQPHVYTTTVQTARSTAFVAEFGLSTKNKTLKGAELTANLVANRGGVDEVIATVPVAHNNGRYTASWTAPHKIAHTGNYKLVFYRNVDTAHAQEKREALEKKQRREAQARGEEVKKTAEEFAVTPLFVIDVPYTAPALTALPVRGEFLTLAALTALLVWLIAKRTNPQ